MKNSPRKVIIAALLVILSFLCIFQVDETQQAVVIQLGKPVRTAPESGIHLKLPWPIQSVTKFEKRLLDYDSAPTEILTRDKKTLLLDNYAKWRIVDPVKLLETVHDETGAQARLDDIIYSELREALGLHDLEEIVSTSRAELMLSVTEACAQKAVEYGIQVLDVRIKRADLPEQNALSIYERMRAERKRIANQYRSEGEEAALIIRAATDSLKVVIMAEAYKKSKIARGEAEAKAIEIYASAFNRDPDFYEFYRTLEAYKVVIDSNTVFVLPPETQFLKYLR